MSGDATYDPQFAYGFGLSYATPAQTPALPEVANKIKYGEKSVYYARGTAWNGYNFPSVKATAHRWTMLARALR
jgi:beta-glucosidase